MANVVAVVKGYYGGIVREPGDAFVIPDERWNDKDKRPSWVKLDPSVAFGGKGDHDCDGSVGGSKPKAETTADDKPAKNKPGRKPKAETVEAPTSKPFADAPEPQTIVEAQKENGGIAPDWIAPDAPKPVDD